MIHFSDNAAAETGDRLAKILPLINILESNFKNLFCPEKDIVIDETLVPWRRRLILRQYIPNKAHRYGIKMFKICSVESYHWGIRIYSGKSATGERETGLAQKVCLELTKDLLNEGRTLFVDNFYTSYDLAKCFLQKNTHVVGTLRANKKDIPKEVLNAKLKRGEMIAKEDVNGIVVLKWRDTRDVRILSTKHAPILKPVCSTQSIQSTPAPQPSMSMQNSAQLFQTTQTQISTYQQTTTSAPTTSTAQPSTSAQTSSSSRMQTTADNTFSARRQRRASEKPLAILAYNKGKSGIDKSDQMASYATSLRKGVKWYCKLGIELILGISVVNAWILYKKASLKQHKICNFKEELAGLMLKLSINNGEQQRSSMTLRAAHHLLKRVNSNGKPMRRYCSSCYKKVKEESGREIARKTAKQTNTYCDKCNGQPQLCLSCFNASH